MICGALQTLNEEACEDVLEETEETKITIDPDLPQTSVIPPSPDAVPGEFQNDLILSQFIYKQYVTPTNNNDKSNKKVTYDDNVVSVDYNKPIIHVTKPTDSE